MIRNKTAFKKDENGYTSGCRQCAGKDPVGGKEGPYQYYKKRSLAIARGEYRPQPDEPKVWFESVRSMAQEGKGKSEKGDR